MPLSQLDPHAALIVIDLQKGMAAFPGMTTMKDVIAHSADLARAFRAHKLPVVLVNVTAPAPGRTDSPRFSLEGFPADWADLVPELEAAPTDILITKQRPGAFIGTDLHEELQRRGVTQVVFTGVSTSNGVNASARSAFDHGYHVVFVAYAMADPDATAHEHNLTQAFPRFGEVTTTSEVLQHLDK